MLSVSEGQGSSGKPQARGDARRGVRGLLDRVLGRRPTSAAPSAPVFKVLFVCMGNVCRSPTAEAVLRHKLRAAGLDGRVGVASAGTHAAWHKDKAPDPRAIAAGKRRGYDLSRLRARTLLDTDFGAYDLILGMDDHNFEVMTRRCPTAFRPRLGTLASHGQLGASAIPDPYYGAPEGFERVLDLIEDACEGLTAHLARHVPGR